VLLLLDAHLSARHIGAPLTHTGHDVASAQPPSPLALLDDEDLLRAATADGRVLASANTKDFAEIAVDFQDRGEPHAGLLLLAGIRGNEFAVATSVITRAFEHYPAQRDWVSLTVAVSRSASQSR
jgi:hypothetical protein